MLALQPTGDAVLAKTYDGSDSVNLASLNVGVSGLVAGQTLVGDLKLQDRNAGQAKALVPVQGALGNTVVNADGTPVFGYTFNTTSLQVSVSPVTLNLTEVQAAAEGTRQVLVQEAPVR